MGEIQLEREEKEGFRPLEEVKKDDGGPFSVEGDRPVMAHSVWSPTQFYPVDFSLSRIGVKKCVFNKRAVKVCVSCSRRCPGTSAPSMTHLTVCPLSYFSNLSYL